MAQLDVYRLPDGGMVVDCQSDLIVPFETRAVIPLLPFSAEAVLMPRLQPVLEINGNRYILATQLIGAIRSRDLQRPITSLAAYEYEIKAALDMLISGF